ncbi:DNA sulfur modification protein DndB [Kordia sp.]|uniref:DNA sulfur modification protein DndB n=1 Tax=Kordia sp. TaxID=1965332 RepID=UPI003D2DEDC8
MKIPALRSKIGELTYYVTTLTFNQIRDFVSPIDDQLHTSETLRDLIQRSITENYVSIKNYILNQPNMFFSSLVLAVYDNYPNWEEIKVSYEEDEYNSIGLLSFPGLHKIFPVDGQHRVEGIKAALEENPELGINKISVIFIGHDNNNKEKTRRLFTTLNRYAKPVSLRDIIALDEDDTVAIITRSLLENFELFKGRRIVDIKNKAIPRTNTDAITSIITLYQANILLAKFYFQQKFDKKPTKKNFNEEFLKFRPQVEVIRDFKSYIVNFWTSFENKLSVVQEYTNTDTNMAMNYRNNTGGNLIFRPVGLLPLISAILVIKERENNLELEEIIEKFDSIDFTLNNTPWRGIMWNHIENKMIMNNSVITRLLLIYLYDKELLTENELVKVQEGYASKLNISEDTVYDTLDAI